MSTAVKRSRFVGIAFVAGTALLGLLATVQAPRDQDTWWHLALGRYIVGHGIPSAEPFSFLHASTPWVQQQWLYEVVLWQMYSAARWLPSIVMGAVGLAAFLVATRTRPLRPGRNDVFVAISLLLNIFVAGELLGVRGQVITVLGVAIVMWIIGRWRDGDHRPLLAIPPLLLLWSNLHAGFFIGIVLLAAALVLPHSQRWQISGQRPPLLLALAVGTAATLINPAGLQIYHYIFATSSVASAAIVEWQSPNFHNFWLRVFEIDAVLLVVAWVLTPGGPSRTDVFFAGAVLCASLFTQRNVSLFAIVATPQLAYYGESAWNTHRQRVLGSWRLRPNPLAAPAAVVLLAVIAIGIAGSLQPLLSDVASGAYERQSQPQAAMNFVLAHYPGERIYASWDSGGYVAFREPSPRVTLIYSEAAGFGDAAINTYLDIALVRTRWLQQLQGLDVKHAILGKDAPEVSAFYEVGWTTDCFDATTSTLVLSAPHDPGQRPSAPLPDPALAQPCQR